MFGPWVSLMIGMREPTIFTIEWVVSARYRISGHLGMHAQMRTQYSFGAKHEYLHMAKAHETAGVVNAEDSQDIPSSELPPTLLRRG